MPKNELDVKWICTHCTYGNWSSAQQCVMCHHKRLNQRTPHVTRSSNAIIAPDDEVANNEIIIERHSPPAAADNELKWACTCCSYYNWMKADKCVMCHVVKPSQLNNIEIVRNMENNNSSQADTQRSSPTDTNSTRTKLARSASLLKSHKWTCQKCTYENWPRTLKCVICHHPKNKQYKSDATTESQIVVPVTTATTTLANRNVRLKKSSSPRRSPPRSPNVLSRQNSANIFDIPTAGEQQADPVSDLALAVERIAISGTAAHPERFNLVKNRITLKDWTWLSACKGVADHDLTSVSNYISMGGERTRPLTPDEVLILTELGVEHAEVGHTLVHLAIKYHHEDILRILLLPANRLTKRLPSQTCPELAATIGKLFAHSMRSRREDFACSFFTELVTFSLPGEVTELEASIEEQLFCEILDLDVQKVLEEESLINWSSELMTQYQSRIYPLWNRATGDCLLDSVLQATWGVFDLHNVMRKKLHESLVNGFSRFFPRWREWEEIQASEMNYSLEEEQWKTDWSLILSLAASAGRSLEQVHVFALAHILRRPIIIYGVKFVKSLHGDTIDLARFEGVYLPLLWNEGFCWKSPIALGYTRGHFSALVSMERPQENAGAGGAGAPLEWNEDDAHVTYLPLVDHDGELLPVHFLTVDELGQEEQLLHKRMECHLTDGGILVAKQTVTPRPPVVNQMIDEWLNRYRKMHSEIGESRSHAQQKKPS